MMFTPGPFYITSSKISENWARIKEYIHDYTLLACSLADEVNCPGGNGQFIATTAILEKIWCIIRERCHFFAIFIINYNYLVRRFFRVEGAV
jgi:hypothetical protein